MQTRERESGGPAHDAQPAGSSRAPGTAPAASPPFPLYETLPVQLSAGPRLQPKLTIGNPDDPFEREADGVAERVMRMPDTTVRLQRKCACGGAGGECEECASKPVSLQRRAAPHAEIDSAAPSIVGEVLRAPGQPLDASTRAFMEPRFGHDFGGVRVHTGWRAEESARSVGALAYTVGQNVVFGAGQYAPETEGGQRLLAHELAHVVQQSSATGAPQVRRTYRPNELMNPDGTPRRSNPVASGPDTNFYPASAASITGRRALVVAGIHGEEASAQALGAEADRQIASRTMATDFNTLFVPRANPGTGRAAGSGATRVPDLNREFGTNYTSPNPIANQISTMVSEFAPERVLSIHAISNRRLGGVFLDPIHSRRTLPAGATPAQQRAEDIASYPAVGTAAERESAFTGDPRNLAAMEMTERMVVATNPAVGTAATPGNAPRAGFPASRRPGTAAGASPNSLIYPLQGAMTGGVSLGVWLSGHGVPVVTIEVPGYRAGPSVWRNYLGGVREFLRIPAPTTTTTPTSTGTTTPPVVQPKLDPRRPGLSLSRAPGSVLQRQPAQITSANVPRRRGRDAAYDTFMRQVYDAQVSIWTSRGAAYTHTVPSADLMTLAAGDSLPGRTIQFDRNVGNAYLLPMLAHARAALSAARAAGDPLARNVTDIRVRSGYRPATEQLSIWNRFYDQYYTDTTTQRQALAGGEHGPDAVNFLANYINQRVFSPGYSPHQQGRTVDLTYLEGTTWATAETDAPNIATWRASWLFNWLQRNAASYAFLQNPNLNEPWHWEFNLNVAVNLLINQIRAFLRRIFPFINWGGEEGEEGQPPTPSETPPSETPRGDAGPIQPKLEVSQPGDPFELEADAVAERVMRMPDTTVRLQRKCACGEGAGCEDCAHKSEGLQRRAAAAEHSQHNSAPDIVQEVLRSPGQALDATTRDFFEPRFRQDFSRVRVHTDEQAAASARAVNALAYTVGTHVVFGAGRYAPRTGEGSRLLAHELAHVVQQGNAGAAPKQDVAAVQRQTPPPAGPVRAATPEERREFARIAAEFLRGQGTHFALQPDRDISEILTPMRTTAQNALSVIANDPAATAVADDVRSAYRAAVREALVARTRTRSGSVRTPPTLQELYEQRRDEILPFGLPQADVDTGAAELSAELEAPLPARPTAQQRARHAAVTAARQRLRVITSQVVIGIDDLFSTQGGTTTVPLPANTTARFSSTIPSGLQRGLTSVAASLVQNGTLTPNTIVMLALDLTQFGGSYDAYRFTRLDLGTLGVEILIERQGAIGVEGLRAEQRQQLQDRFDRMGFRRTGFSQGEFDQVLIGLGEIPDAQLTALGALRFTRQRGASATTPSAAAEYDQATHTVNVFDNAFTAGRARMGRAGRVLTFAAHAVVHEVGHAHDLSALRTTGASRDRAQAALLAEFGTGGGNFRIPAPGAPDRARFDQLMSALTAAQTAETSARSLSGARWTTGGTATVTDALAAGARQPAFRQAALQDGGPAGRQMPTTYPNPVSVWQEYFAESFALYQTAPDQLRRMRPNVFRFMQQQFPR